MKYFKLLILLCVLFIIEVSGRAAGGLDDGEYQHLGVRESDEFEMDILKTNGRRLMSIDVAGSIVSMAKIFESTKRFFGQDEAVPNPMHNRPVDDNSID